MSDCGTTLSALRTVALRHIYLIMFIWILSMFHYYLYLRFSQVVLVVGVEPPMIYHGVNIFNSEERLGHGYEHLLAHAVGTDHGTCSHSPLLLVLNYPLQICKIISKIL